MEIYCCVETSCMMHSFAKSLSNASGDIGFLVFGSRGGGTPSGSSWSML